MMVIFIKHWKQLPVMYAVTKDKKLDAMMDKAIATIAKAQRKDGYIYTPVEIEERKTRQGKNSLKTV